MRPTAYAADAIHRMMTQVTLLPLIDYRREATFLYGVHKAQLRHLRHDGLFRICRPAPWAASTDRQRGPTAPTARRRLAARPRRPTAGPDPQPPHCGGRGPQGFARYREIEYQIPMSRATHEVNLSPVPWAVLDLLEYGALCGPTL